MRCHLEMNYEAEPAVCEVEGVPWCYLFDVREQLDILTE